MARINLPCLPGCSLYQLETVYVGRQPAKPSPLQADGPRASLMTFKSRRGEHATAPLWRKDPDDHHHRRPGQLHDLPIIRQAVAAKPSVHRGKRIRRIFVGRSDSNKSTITRTPGAAAGDEAHRFTITVTCGRFAASVSSWTTSERHPGPSGAKTPPRGRLFKTFGRRFMNWLRYMNRRLRKKKYLYYSFLQDG